MFQAVIVEGRADEEKRSCYDCFYNQVAITWWCVNKKAIEYRGTSSIGIYNCHFWKSAKYYEELSLSEKTNGSYIKIKCGKDSVSEKTNYVQR